MPAYHHVYIKHNKEPLIPQQKPEWEMTHSKEFPIYYNRFRDFQNFEFRKCDAPKPEVSVDYSSTRGKTTHLVLRDTHMSKRATWAPYIHTQKNNQLYSHSFHACSTKRFIHITNIYSKTTSTACRLPG